MLIYINYNFDFLGLDNVRLFLKLRRQRTHKMSRFLSHLQHSRPCCIRYNTAAHVVNSTSNTH